MRKKATATTGSKIPAGFPQIKTGSFAPIHDWKKTPILQGIVQATRTVEQKRGGKLIPVRVVDVANSDGEITAVWESHSIAETLAQAKPGDEIFLSFEGIKKLKGKKTLTEFVCAIQPG